MGIKWFGGGARPRSPSAWAGGGSHDHDPTNLGAGDRGRTAGTGDHGAVLYRCAAHNLVVGESGHGAAGCASAAAGVAATGGMVTRNLDTYLLRLLLWFYGIQCFMVSLIVGIPFSSPRPPHRSGSERLGTK